MDGTLGGLLYNLGLTEEAKKRGYTKTASAKLEEELDRVLDKAFKKIAEENVPTTTKDPEINDPEQMLENAESDLTDEEKAKAIALFKQRRAKIIGIASMFDSEKKRELFAKLASSTIAEMPFVVRDHDFSLRSSELGTSAGGQTDQWIFSAGVPINTLL